MLGKGMALSLSLAMALSGVPTQALAETADQLAPSVSANLVGKSVESGTWGSCPWTIDADGVLTVYPGKGVPADQNSPWSKYKGSITKAVFVSDGASKVVLPEDSTALFGWLDHLVSVDFSGVDTSNVTSTRFMFAGCTALETIDFSRFYTTSVVDMYQMFLDCESLTSLDLRSFNTSKVREMSTMFCGCTSLTSVDLSSFDTSSVTDTYNMFKDCSALKTIYVGEAWTMDNVDEFGYAMFSGCTNLVGGYGTTYDPAHVDFEYARIDRPGTPGYLTPKAKVAPAFKGVGLTLAREIGLNFTVALPKENNLDFSDSFITLSIDDKDARSEDVAVSQDQIDQQAASFIFDVTTVEIAEPVTAVFHYKDSGVEKTIELSYCVQDYFYDFDKQEDKYDDNTIALVHALANMGYHLSGYLYSINDWELWEDYNAVNKDYFPVDWDNARNGLKKYNTKAALGDSGIKAKASVSFDSLTAINVSLNAPAGADVSATATFGNRTSEAVKQADGRWFVRVEGIRPQHLDKDVHVTGTCNGKPFSIDVSVLSLLNAGFDTNDNLPNSAFSAVFYYWQIVSDFHV